MASTSEVKPKPVLVTAAIIRDGGRILIARRKISDSPESGKWEFPGGKVEFGESPQACLVREIREELNLEIDVGEIYDVGSQVYLNREKPFHVILLFFNCRVLGGELRLLDAADATWVTSSKLAEFDFAQADLTVVERLKVSAI